MDVNVGPLKGEGGSQLPRRGGRLTPFAPPPPGWNPAILQHAIAPKTQSMHKSKGILDSACVTVLLRIHTCIHTWVTCTVVAIMYVCVAESQLLLKTYPTVLIDHQSVVVDLWTFGEVGHVDGHSFVLVWSINDILGGGGLEGGGEKEREKQRVKDETKTTLTRHFSNDNIISILTITFQCFNNNHSPVQRTTCPATKHVDNYDWLESAS